MKQIRTGVENTNNNTYDETISAIEFYTRVNFDAIPNGMVRINCRSLLERAKNGFYLLEHVDTHNLEDNDWRVQLRLVVPRSELDGHWDEIVDMMKLADPRWEKDFQVDARFMNGDTAFYGKITFVVPGK